MKIAGIEAVKTTEGKARLLVPKASLSDPHHCEVFYNPAMEFSRSVSSAAFWHAAKKIGGKISLLDGLCATGIRGLRYCAESASPVEATFCDANPKAIAFAKKNAKLNGITDAGFECRDFHLAAASGRYGFVELDPFGTPTVFLDSAVRACRKKSALSVTATDLANLCGARPKACIREYEAVPARGFFCHETALRILIGRIARTAALHEKSYRPFLSYYRGYHVKAIGFVEGGAIAADRAVERIGTLGFCKTCFAFFENVESCPDCSHPLAVAGPLWLGKLSDSSALKAMVADTDVERQNPTVNKFLRTVLLENEFEKPGYLDIPELCSAAKRPILTQIEKIIGELRALGFKAVRTHFSPTGIRTDAKAADVLRVASAD